MKFNISSEKLLSSLSVIHEAVSKALVGELENELGASELVEMSELVDEAYEQVETLRAQVKQYDLGHREKSLRPHINPKEIADNIVQIFSERHKVRYIPRAYAYKVLFIMYIICRVKPPIRCSWWERTFLEGLPDYLNKSDFFKDTNPKWRMDMIVDQLTSPTRLPLDVEPIVPIQKPEYPSLTPINVQNNYMILLNPHIETMESDGCQQFFGKMYNPSFKSTSYGR